MDQYGKHTFGFGYHPPKQKAFRKLKRLSKRMGKGKVKDKVGKAVALWRPFKELHTDWSEVVHSRTAQGLKGWASQVNFSCYKVHPFQAQELNVLPRLDHSQRLWGAPTWDKPEEMHQKD